MCVVDFEPDTFGHPASLPTILTQGGVRYYYHCRGSRGPHLYWWVGPDDSRILSFNDIQWYMHFDVAHRHVAIESSMADPLIPYSAGDWIEGYARACTVLVITVVVLHVATFTVSLICRQWPIYPQGGIFDTAALFREC